ncbi:hypothetical protein Tco_1266785 [Tanacetum coccineum]
MYTVVFKVDVPTTQSQPSESTQGMHRITSTSRTPNPEVTEGESSAQPKPTMIRFHVPRRPDLETPIPTSVNVSKVKEHMVDKELDQLLEGAENVDVDAFMDDVLNKEESAGDEFELRRREKGKGIEEIKDTPLPTPIRSPRTHIAYLSSDKETL